MAPFRQEYPPIYSIGYNGNGNLNSLIDRTLRLGYNSSGKLEGLLPETIKKALNECKRPDPNIPILYLEGTLLPGFSGAPVIDKSGDLLGIADGGLERGASSISWAIGSTYLANLENSNEIIPATVNCGIGNSVTFASDINFDYSNVKTIEFDKLVFVKTKTRTVYEMIQTVDDTMGLNQLLRGLAINTNFNYTQFKYDVYEEITTGAVYCVPVDASLERRGDAIKATFLDGDFTFLTMIKAGVPVSDTATTLRYNRYITHFQGKIIEMDGGKLIYGLDYNFSYRMPIQYVDGFVNRVAFQGYQLDTASTGQIISKPVSYSFQTLIGRKDIFFGVAVVNHASTSAVVQEVNNCLFSNNCKLAIIPPSCVVSCKRMELFSKLIIGVHMSGLSRPNTL